MQFTVVIPDTAAPQAIEALSQQIHKAGGTIMPEEAEPGVNPDANAPGITPMPPAGPPGGPLAAGPGAGMLPGAAMAKMGAFALRPRQ